MDVLQECEKIENKEERKTLRGVSIIEDFLQKLEGQQPTLFVVVSHRMHVRMVKDILQQGIPIRKLREQHKEFKLPQPFHLLKQQAAENTGPIEKVKDIEYCSVVAIEQKSDSFEMIYDNYSEHIKF